MNFYVFWDTLSWGTVPSKQSPQVSLAPASSPPPLLWLTGTSAPTKWESFTLPGPEEPALGIHVVLDPGPVSLLYVEPVLEVAEDSEYEERVQLLLLVLPPPCQV